MSNSIVNPFQSDVFQTENGLGHAAQSLLLELLHLDYLEQVDIHFAQFLLSQCLENVDDISDLEANLLLLLSAKLSNEVIHQHTCLDLNQFEVSKSFPLHQMSNREPQLPLKSKWLTILYRLGVCSDACKEYNTPLVHFNGLLYFSRYYGYEKKISQFIKGDNVQGLWFQKIKPTDKELALNKYFSITTEPDRQREAVNNAAGKKFTVVSGGPGTGKTTTVVKLLLVLQELKLLQDNKPLKIWLIAPTGKAAQRLAESIESSLGKMEVAKELINNIPTTALTIHRALKPQGLTDFHYNESNKLPCDLVVLDEASMVDTSLLFSLTSALPAHSQLILLGDKQQLASIEAGNILADIALTNNNKYISELTKSYRFTEESEIGQLAQAIKRGEPKQASQVLSTGSSVKRLANNKQQLAVTIEMIVEHYLALYEISEPLNEIDKVFKHIGKIQLLTCVREGDRGVTGLNEMVRQRLAQRGVVRFNEEHYHLRPIMITENAYHLDLYNGDIGVQLFDDNVSKLATYFLTANQEMKIVHNQRLPTHQPAYAMTVHKSQGSEFDHAILVLPEKATNKIERALLYTGLTRAKKQFTLLAEEAQLQQSILTKTNRRSGLAIMLEQD